MEFFYSKWIILGCCGLMSLIASSLTHKWISSVWNEFEMDMGYTKSFNSLGLKLNFDFIKKKKNSTGL